MNLLFIRLYIPLYATMNLRRQVSLYAIGQYRSEQLLSISSATPKSDCFGGVFFSLTGVGYLAYD